VKKVIIAILAIICVATLVYAADEPKPQATEPVGAVIETLGVFTGKITNVIEKSAGNKGQLILADDSGKTKVIPLDNTVKIIDKGFHAVTLNQLKPGERVSVEQGKGGTTVKVMK
jgi:hypothetical protein